ncbi:MAG: hypothetical protein JNN20_12710 [Betaproteobacteria bacterium]|nr:hypothetical protein [Betaproteobacteria bacterium]
MQRWIGSTPRQSNGPADQANADYGDFIQHNGAEIKDWRGFSAIFGLEASPVLGFSISIFITPS